LHGPFTCISGRVGRVPTRSAPPFEWGGRGPFTGWNGSFPTCLLRGKLGWMTPGSVTPRPNQRNATFGGSRSQAGAPSFFFKRSPHERSTQTLMLFLMRLQARVSVIGPPCWDPGRLIPDNRPAAPSGRLAPAKAAEAGRGGRRHGSERLKKRDSRVVVRRLVPSFPARAFATQVFLPRAGRAR
jgi:hypothetical protein